MYRSHPMGEAIHGCPRLGRVGVPDSAASWTLGFDIAPPDIADLEVSMTYFNIDYRDRIRTPFPSGYDSSGVLLDPLYAPVVAANPTPIEVATLLDRMPSVECYTEQGDYVSPCSNPPIDEITAIIDGRVTNLAAVRTSGLDLSMRYGLRSAIGTWGFALNGQYMLDSRERIVPGAPHIDGINNVWRPVDLRLRNSVSFARGGFAATAFINFTDGYPDTRPAGGLAGPLQRASVASWTTVDLTMQIDLTERLSRFGLPAATLALTATNLFDRDPPFVAHAYGINFDGVNASPLGRFIGAQLTARWGGR